MKSLYILTLTILTTITLAKGQDLPNTFKVENFVEILPGDSIKVWYNCVGAISNASCAQYYRIGKIDPDNIGFVGEFHDYDMNGKLIYKASMLNGVLNGTAFFYYPNGQIKETGTYVNDERQGIWKYYYIDGSEKKIFNFEMGNPLIVEERNNKGVFLVKGGNGNYSGEFFPARICESYLASGPVIDGKMNGTWKFGMGRQTLSSEIFDKGKFLKGAGYDGYEYNESRILLSGFYPNENSQMSSNNIGCPGDKITSFMLNSETIATGFYPKLIEKIKQYPDIKKQWLIVGLDFDKPNRIKNINVYSSKNDLGLETYVHDYIGTLSDWQAAKTSSQNKPMSLFFTINVDERFGDERVLILAEYMIRTGAIFLQRHLF